MRRRTERGQALVLAAIMITVLIGFVGLVVDGGEAANEQQIVRAAADGAALAGIYSLSKGSTTAAATTLAQQVLVAVPLPIADLTMSYLDVGGNPTAITANVVTVRAVVADSHRTFFLAALGKPTLLLTATAEAKNRGGGGSPGVPAACAVCLMETAGNALNQLGGNGSITVTGGPMQINADLNQGDGPSLTAPSIVVVGQVQQGSGTVTPNPSSGSAITDPLVAIPLPAVGGASTAFTYPGGTSPLNPGIYSTITVNSGTLILNPGTYAITGGLVINGGTVTGAGVTLVLGCTPYPTACAGAGGHITMTAGRLNLSPPTCGSYTGLTVFGDRGDTSANTFSQATLNISGTWYTVKQALTLSHASDGGSFGQLVVASLNTPSNSVFTASRSATTSYGTGTACAGGMGLTL